MADNNKSDPVAIAALIISVVALFAAVSQIVQAIFASARGLPNCDERVIGKWALKKWALKNGRTQLRYQELRLEVFFEAPIIFLAPKTNSNLPQRGEKWIADGSDESCLHYRIDPEEITVTPGQKEQVHTVENEKATWVWLLVAIQRMEKDSLLWEGECIKTAGPGPTPDFGIPSLTVQMQRIRRSFDTNPAIKKPYATTTISHVVELAAVLGLYWKVFDRDENKYRAAGNGYSLMGTRVTDFGIVFVFEKTGAPEFKSRRIIPTAEVKELCFGRLPTLYRKDNLEQGPEDITWLNVLKTSSGDKDLTVEVLQLGSRAEIAETLTQIGCNVTTTLYYRDNKKHRHLFPVTFEIIGMLARTLHVRNRPFRFLPNPTMFHWDFDSLSLIRLLLAFSNLMKRDSEIIKKELLSKQVKDNVRLEIHDIEQLAQDAKSLHDVVKGGGQLTHTRMNIIHDALDKTDAKLTEGPSPSSNQQVVLDVLRRHLQEVLGAINTDTPGRNDSTSFGMLREIPLEVREQRFMETYFDRILWRVIPLYTNSAEKSEQEEVSRAIHKDTDERKSRVANADETSPPSPETAAPTQNLVKTRSWPPKQTTKKTNAKEKHEPQWGTTLGSYDETQRLKIWYTLVFRMICWLMLHDFDKKDIQVPSSELMGNRQPVFIM